MSTFLSLSDDDIELLNRQFGLKLTREEWNRRLTTTPTFASLVRSYFDWHISELAALAAGDDRLPAGINAIDAPFPPTARGASEPDARLRAARFMLETIRPIPEDGEAREKRISLLTEPLHSGALPDAAFVRRVLYLAGRWYHPKSRRKTPRNPVRSRSFKLKVRETHGLFIDSNSAPII